MNRINRRDFLASVAAWPVLPAIFRGDPYRPISGAARAASIRVRGRVASLGRGLAGVGVTDGLSVVSTNRDGHFELVTDTARRHVSVSVPAGYHLPTAPAGTVRSFHPLVADARGEMAAQWNLAPIDGGDRRHAFLLLADIQTQDRDDMTRFQRESVPDLAATIGRLGSVPIFGVGDGDIMWDRLAMYDDYEAAVKQLGVPFVQVVGNHDLDLDRRTDEDSTTTFEGRFGPRYYSFDRGEVHYVVLDDVFYYDGGYLGYVGADQLTWLRNDLARVEAGRSVVVFAHIPFMTGLSERQGRAPGIASYVVNRAAVYEVLARYRTTILTGHLHENDFGQTGSIHERNLGAVCGGWWTGDLCYDGTPNGYGVYEVDGAEIRWRYQATGKDPGHQLRVYPRGADPAAPDEFVANVWAYEPGWTVSWYHGGQRRGEMARRVGLDPLANDRLAGDQRPAKRTWVDPVRTGHLFYAPAPQEPGEIRVEATDRWGRTYSEVLR
ncbi:MAG: calcineurin-like phosphoesterase C-terminal domain-containing protein [Gemmatimonadales bacterium]